MNQRVLLAGLAGAVAMFVWTSIAHMALPLGEAGIQQISTEQALLQSMDATIKSPGLYMFPNMPAGMSQEEYAKKSSSGPSGLMVYFPRREFSMGTNLAIEFLTEFVEVLIAVYLLSLTTLGSFGGRLGFFAILGLCAAIVTNVPYWNWYGFPSTYTCAQIFTQWTAYLSAGAAVAAMKIGGSPHA